MSTKEVQTDVKGTDVSEDQNIVGGKEPQENDIMNGKGKEPEEPGELSNKLFDPSRLRLRQDFHKLAEVKKSLLTIPVQKPHRQEFIRVHPDENMSMSTFVLDLAEDRETYLVEPDLWDDLRNEIQPKMLLLTMNRQNVLRLWPISLPKDDRINRWHQSALEAAEIAKREWIRVASNMGLGAYEVIAAMGEVAEPVWPKLSLEEILKIAFKDRYIRSHDHIALKKLRGKA